ncbi:cystatin-like protein [Misgurnus anguillicaudatus]|uniref:cystatin-like protein n=1 Tax=Misgurnus anguillicaudatus TaxID=75329 RepID=UPI003CCF5453
MRGLLWLVGAGLLLGSIDGGDTYEQLDDTTRNIVDKAIIKANEKYGKKHHIDFHSIIYVVSYTSLYFSDYDNSRLFHVLLKPTSCGKGPRVHRKECTLENNLKPWVSCVACGENMACRPFRNQEKINELIKKCGSEFHTPYQHGGGHIMSDTMDEKNYGCLECN